MLANGGSKRVRRKLRLSGWTRLAVIFLFSVVLAAYVLGPFVWLASSSIQNEREIISVPPHWVPEDPTLLNFKAIFFAQREGVTYETRTQADPVSGGYIPSTAKNLLTRFIHITLPSLRPGFMLVFIYETMMAIRHFDLFFILTEGGPAQASHVASWHIYVETFRNLSFGTGNALAYVMAIVTFALAYFIIRTLGRRL